MTPRPRPLPLRTVSAALLALALAACGAKEQPAPPTPVVGFIVAKPADVPQLLELPGRTSAFAMSEVRPQVSGIIQQRLFEEGSLVRAGQTLYQIDPSLYRASSAQAEANLASAQASAEAARARADRYRPLAEMEAVSKQDYVDAAAAARQASAAIAQNRAQLQTAQINLRYTRVPAPISGRISRSSVTRGALVTSNQADPLAVIQQLDPIYVDMQQSSAQLLSLRRALGQNGKPAQATPVTLKLEDGSTYPVSGHVEFSEVMVDPNTGTVTLRARFPNPDGLLLPGMFVRASFAPTLDRGVYLIPQGAVARDPNGDALIWIVGKDNKAVQQHVVTSRAQGEYWVVTRGISPGMRIITQGVGKLRPGATVKAVPANTPQNLGEGANNAGEAGH